MLLKLLTAILMWKEDNFISTNVQKTCIFWIKISSLHGETALLGLYVLLVL